MSTPNKIQILLTGATGYLGGSVLDRLLKHPSAASFIITALVRSQEKAQKLESLGVKAAVGSLVDTTLVQDLAASSDMIFSIATVESETATGIMLAGAKKRYQKTGTRTVVIHTAGASIVSDDDSGMTASEVVVSDTDADTIEAFPLTTPHRKTNAALVAADKEGYVRVHIICPGNVWGTATGAIVDAGVQSPQSKVIPLLLDIGTRRGAAGMIGLGKNIWVHVSLEDLLELYMKLFDAAWADDITPHGRFGFYFAGNGALSMYDFSKAIGEALVAAGKITSPEPTSLSEQEISAMPFMKLFGKNHCVKCDHARAVGWKPVQDVHAMLASIKGCL
ncbi:hypothetical protein HWV62_43387 [Athelia sp. TMB]|nr:hypothetical protein HWV62_43387 [Athelia sp. TMB]